MRYDAFISYSHQADPRLGPRLQSALQWLARPWWSPPRCRIFLDQTDLTANPRAWSTIEGALDQSRFLILLCSPRATESKWVEMEVKHWLATRENGTDTLLLALTNGSIAWDDTRSDFSEAAHVPRPLRGRFDEEPLWVDLTALDEDAHFSRSNPVWITAVARLGAPLLGLDLAKVISEDHHRHRQRLRHFGGLLTVTAVAAIVAGLQWRVAEHQRAQAEERATVIEAQLLAALADQQRASSPSRSLSLAIEALKRHPSPGPGARRAVLQPFLEGARLHSVVFTGDHLMAAALHPNGRRLAVSAGASQFDAHRLHLLAHDDHGWEPVPSSNWIGAPDALSFTAGGLLAIEQGKALLLDSAGNVRRSIGAHARSAAMNPRGTHLALASEQSVDLLRVDEGTTEQRWVLSQATVAFLDDGRLLIAGIHNDGRPVLCAIGSGQEACVDAPSYFAMDIAVGQASFVVGGDPASMWTSQPELRFATLRAPLSESDRRAGMTTGEARTVGWSPSEVALSNQVDVEFWSHQGERRATVGNDRDFAGEVVGSHPNGDWFTMTRTEIRRWFDTPQPVVEAHGTSALGYQHVGVVKSVAPGSFVSAGVDGNLVWWTVTEDRVRQDRVQHIDGGAAVIDFAAASTAVAVVVDVDGEPLANLRGPLAGPLIRTEPSAHQVERCGASLYALHGNKLYIEDGNGAASTGFELADPTFFTMGEHCRAALGVGPRTRWTSLSRVEATEVAETDEYSTAASDGQGRTTAFVTGNALECTLWVWQEGELLLHRELDHGIDSLALDPSGETLFVAASTKFEGERVRAVDVATGQVVFDIAIPVEVTALDVDRGGAFVIVGRIDGKVQLLPLEPWIQEWAERVDLARYDTAARALLGLPPGPSSNQRVDQVGSAPKTPRGK